MLVPGRCRWAGPRVGPGRGEAGYRVGGGPGWVPGAAARDVLPRGACGGGLQRWA